MKIQAFLFNVLFGDWNSFTVTLAEKTTVDIDLKTGTQSLATIDAVEIFLANYHIVLARLATSKQRHKRSSTLANNTAKGATRM